MRYFKFFYKGFDFDFCTEDLRDISFEQTFYSNLTHEQKRVTDLILETYLKTIQDNYYCTSDSIVCITEFEYKQPIQVSFDF
jgi:hypothetical protein